MGRCLGRAWADAAALLLTIGALLKPAFAYAQEDEVIADPELQGAGSGQPQSSGRDGDEVIADPELGGTSTPKRPEDYGWGDVYKPKTAETESPARAEASEAEEPDPMANTGIGRLELAGQTEIDLHKEGSLEDFYEARLRMGGEIDFRVSRKLRISLGTRIDFGWYAPHQDDPALKNRTVYAPEQPEGTPSRTVDLSLFDQDRYELDIIPMAAYVDGTLAEGVHLRVGAQVISLGRMDGLSVTDMLAVLDFRPTAKADPSRLKLPQPALRLDWDLSSWATLQVIYVPWFMPHLQRPNRDTYVGSVLTGFPAPNSNMPTSVADRGRSPITESFERSVDPSWQTVAGEANMRFVGPPPDFSHPQAEARINFRGSSFEVAVLGGTALEKVPAIYYTPDVNDAIVHQGTPKGDDAVSDLSEQIAAGYSVFDVEYHRYYLVGLDGSFDIAPMQISFELAYSPSRHLYAQSRYHDRLPLPDVAPDITDPIPATSTLPGVPSNVTNASIRKGTQMVQAALHAEYLRGEELALVAEGYLFQALSLPHDQTRDWLGFKGKGNGTFVGGLIAGAYSLKEGKYRFDLSMLAMMGPSFIITPQFEAEVTDGFFLNVGVQIYEGPTPNNIDKKGRPIPNYVATNLTAGGVLSGYDNVYLGFRWVP